MVSIHYFIYYRVRWGGVGECIAIPFRVVWTFAIPFRASSYRRDRACPVHRPPPHPGGHVAYPRRHPISGRVDVRHAISRVVWTFTIPFRASSYCRDRACPVHRPPPAPRRPCCLSTASSHSGSRGRSSFHFARRRIVGTGPALSTAPPTHPGGHVTYPRRHPISGRVDVRHPISRVVVS